MLPNAGKLLEKGGQIIKGNKLLAGASKLLPNAGKIGDLAKLTKKLPGKLGEVVGKIPVPNKVKNLVKGVVKYGVPAAIHGVNVAGFVGGVSAAQEYVKKGDYVNAGLAIVSGSAGLGHTVKSVGKLGKGKVNGVENKVKGSGGKNNLLSGVEDNKRGFERVKDKEKEVKSQNSTQSSVTLPSRKKRPNGGVETTTHPHHPEIEPGVVAKEKTHDGHEIKVLKDGRVVRCSDCEEIRNKYAEQLEQKPELKQRLNEIDQIANPQEKAKQTQQLEQELASIEPSKIIDKNGGDGIIKTPKDAPSYSLEGKTLVDTVLNDTNEIIDRTKLPKGDPRQISNKELARLNATARAQSPDPLYRTPHFENITPKDAQGRKINIQDFLGCTIVGQQGTEDLFRVSDIDKFMDEIKRLYGENGSTLHPYLEKRIRDLVTNAQQPFNSTRGVPGLHAEVQAANNALHHLTSQGYDVEQVVGQIGIATGKVSRGAGGKFEACPNCSAILEQFSILTDWYEPHK